MDHFNSSSEVAFFVSKHCNSLQRNNTHRNDGDVIVVRRSLGTGVAMVNIGTFNAMTLASVARRRAGTGENADIAEGRRHDTTDTMGSCHYVLLADDGTTAKVLTRFAQRHLVRVVADVGVFTADDPFRRCSKGTWNIIIKN